MAVVATGFFDGVHKGHQEVINKVVSSAHCRGEEAIIITFARHPRTILQQDARTLRLLNSAEEKITHLKALGVDRVEVLDFNRAFASLTALEYLKLLIERYGATCLVMGYDNRLGSDKLTPGEVRPLALGLGIGFIVVDALPSSLQSGGCRSAEGSFLHSGGGFVEDSSLRSGGGCSAEDSCLRSGGGCSAEDSCLCSGGGCGSAISSTVIRTALSSGRVELASEMLGYDYSLCGVVVGGKQLGRKLGFPTANMQMYDPLKLVPGRGVYLTKVHTLGRDFYGMTNIADIVETHIFDFNEDIYGLDIKIFFLKHLRDCQHFNSLEELKSQLTIDQTHCLSILNGIQV